MQLKKLVQKLFPDRPAPEVYAGLKQKSPVYWFRNWRSTSEYKPQFWSLASDEDL